jgi:hypothetical protein
MGARAGAKALGCPGCGMLDPVTNSDVASVGAAAPQGAEPCVRHYTELLLLPFRLVKGTQPYEVEALNLQTMADKLCAHGGAWRPLPAATVDVALPEGAKHLSAEMDAMAWQQHQALCYFHPTVRSFLFGSRRIADNSKGNAPNDYLRAFRRHDVQRVWVRVWNTDAKAVETRVFKVVRCDLALFQPDVGVLQLELQADIGSNQGWPLSAVQRVRDELRRLFPPYVSDWPTERGMHGGHCPVSVGWSSDGANASAQSTMDLSGAQVLKRFLSVESAAAGSAAPGLPMDAEALPVFEHWAAWLGLDDFLKTQGWRWLSPGDDRLPSLAFVALDNPRGLSRGDWVRLGFADAPGSDELPYARGALVDFEARYCYDRFWHEASDSTDAPSRIMNCGYAFTMVGSFADKGFFMNPLNGAWVAFRQIYARMGLVAHFQKAALHGSLARLSALAWRQSDGSLSYDQPDMHERLKRFYAEFLEFTQVYWFDEVSPQSQGVELFEMWQRELRSKALYEEVRQELKDLVEYMNTRAAQRQADEAIKQTRVAEDFTRVAVVLGVVGVVAGLLGMNWLPLDAEPWTLESPFSWANLVWLAAALLVTMALAVATWIRRPVRLVRWLALQLEHLRVPKEPKS